MPDSTVLTLAARPSALAAFNCVRRLADAWVIAERDVDTGLRLKYYSRAADVAYWTEFWNNRAGLPYAREKRGHLPHQLKGVLKRWVRPGGTVLEAGCGLGHFTVSAHANGYRAEGIDWSAETVGRLQQRFPSIRWHVGDVRRPDFPDDTFDAVYSPGVCEHFEEGPTDVLRETHRILRPGGIAIVSTPCFNPWLQRRFMPVAAGADWNGADFYQYAFTPEGMARLLGTLGFELLQIRPYAVLDTFVQYYGWRVADWWSKPLALALDYVPYVRQWGSTCLWIARKPEWRTESAVQTCG